MSDHNPRTCKDWHCSNCGQHSSSQGHWNEWCHVAGNITEAHFCCPGGNCERITARFAEARSASTTLMVRARKVAQQRLPDGLAWGFDGDVA